MAIQIESETPCILDPSKGYCPGNCELKRFAIKKWIEIALDEGVDPSLYPALVADDPAFLEEHRSFIVRNLGMTGEHLKCSHPTALPSSNGHQEAK